MISWLLIFAITSPRLTTLSPNSLLIFFLCVSVMSWNSAIFTFLISGAIKGENLGVSLNCPSKSLNNTGAPKDLSSYSEI